MPDARSHRRRRGWRASAGACLAALALASTASADALIVNDTGNEPDASPGDGLCESFPSATCTLRAAIEEINWTGGGSVDLTAVGGTIPGPVPGITSDISIVGPGADELTVAGFGGYSAEGQSPPYLAVSGLTVGYVGVSGREEQDIDGNVLYVNRAQLVLREVTVTGSGGPGVYGYIASIDAFDSTVSGNAAEGIFATNNTSVSVYGSTISNSVRGVVVNGANDHYEIAGPSSARLFSVTFADNSAPSGGKDLVVTGIHPDADPDEYTEIRNVVFADRAGGAGSAGDNCSSGVQADAAFPSIEEGGTSCGAIPVANARLGPLADNGGPTFTHALLSGSPAIDTGSSEGYRSGHDQRGLPRPVDIPGVGKDGASNDPTDIGAFEVQAPIQPPAPMCNGRPATIDRTGDNTGGTVNGTSGSDVIITGNGADTVDGKGGDDVICAHDGADRVIGGNGDDVLVGGDQNDEVLGGAGNDTVLGADGNDRVNGGAGNDVVRGQNDDDILNGGTGDDTVIGGDGGDVLAGGVGTDRCAGDFNGATASTGTDRVTANGMCETTVEVP